MSEKIVYPSSLEHFRKFMQSHYGNQWTADNGEILRIEHIPRGRLESIWLIRSGKTTRNKRASIIAREEILHQTDLQLNDGQYIHAGTQIMPVQCNEIGRAFDEFRDDIKMQIESLIKNGHSASDEQTPMTIEKTTKKVIFRTSPPGRHPDSVYDASFQKIATGELTKSEAYHWFLEHEKITKPDKNIRDAWNAAMKRRRDKMATK